MRRLILFVLILIALAFTACDRFDNELTKPEDEQREVAQTIVHAFDGASAEELSPLYALFHEDYLYDGITQEARIAQIGSLLQEHDALSFEIEVSREKHLDETNAELNWKLTAYAEELLLELIFIKDRAIKDAEGWRLTGNGESGEEEENPAQLVIAEYFTFSTCPNCPPAEAKLRELAQTHSNFIFLEHHTMIHYTVPGNDNHAYYGNPPAPAAVFQGQNVVRGSSADALGSYDSMTQQYIDQPSTFAYTISEFEKEGSALSAKVSLELASEVDFEDMYLNYVVIAERMINPLNTGEYFYNVVRSLGRRAIAESDLGKPLDISLSLPDDMPENGKLVIYVQKRPEGFDYNARIYGGEVFAF